MAQEYASAIRQAQAENDLAKAEALYAAAKEEARKLLNQGKQAEAENLLNAAAEKIWDKAAAVLAQKK